MEYGYVALAFALVAIIITLVRSGHAKDRTKEERSYRMHETIVIPDGLLYVPQAITRWGEDGEPRLDPVHPTGYRDLAGAMVSVVGVTDGYVEVELVESAAPQCRYPRKTRFMYREHDYAMLRSRWRKEADEAVERDQALRQFGVIPPRAKRGSKGDVS